MALLDFFIFFFSFHLFLLKFCDSKCPKSFPCQNVGSLDYPLTDVDHPDCGLIKINCSSPPKLQFVGDANVYEVAKQISKDKFTVRDTVFQFHLQRNNCISFKSPFLSVSPLISFVISPNLTLYLCDRAIADSSSVKEHFKYYKNYSNCDAFDVYYRDPDADGNLANDTHANIPSGCHFIQLPMNASENSSDDLFKLLTYEYTIEWHVSIHKQENSKKKKVILAAVIPGAAFLVCLLACFIIWRNKKRATSAYLLSRNISSDPSSKSDIEGGSFYFGIPVFSYTELMEATNNFDSSRELGDGGFGTVYHGKLRDGREVAIKRLYEHNYRRVEQFMNEIKILTCLRHPNLVLLYGCTSRRSRELLLVYEYVPNGTVADHLHGERAEESPLTWSIRMNIAVGTAGALSYLHKSDIIHRDVKTNNILLDENFCVKVADFGLSRLFPNDVTHISTAPQGTPGYVDPEYHQCYQLTGKSDVYSFGVVLIELISSMPAVDITRHRHEINLANLALNKIQKCAFHELIDSSLGYDTDDEVKRMTTSVAELAFRCLQPENEMRPSMDEVLAFLKDIQNGDDHELIIGKGKEENGNGKILHSPETDDVVLLKNKNQLSPIAVTDKWISSSSTIESSSE